GVRECGAAFLLLAFEWGLSTGVALAGVVGTDRYGLYCHGRHFVSGRGGHDRLDIENHAIPCIVACCLDRYRRGHLFRDSCRTRSAAYAISFGTKQQTGRGLMQVLRSIRNMT